jgi:hypothetical protein
VHPEIRVVATPIKVLFVQAFQDRFEAFLHQVSVDPTELAGLHSKASLRAGAENTADNNTCYQFESGIYLK